MKNILVAPLHWGLGHATRCIPIIRELQARGHNLFIASDGAAGYLLRQEFPELPYDELPSYAITYPRSWPNLFWLSKLPRILQVIRAEHRCLSKIIEDRQIDVVISDNRYGVFHSKTRNVFVSHQLQIPGRSLLHRLANALLAKRIERFDEVWVPDIEKGENLSGILSEIDLKIPKHYIGIPSRMASQDVVVTYDLCVILSGPEPYRHALQEQVKNKVKGKSLRIVWILGLPQQHGVMYSLKDEIYSHLNAFEMSRVLQSSKVVISRSGYTSILDYYSLGVKAILIPTPFQPEQQYLARRHAANANFYVPKEDLSDLMEGYERLSQASSMRNEQGKNKLRLPVF